MESAKKLFAYIGVIALSFAIGFFFSYRIYNKQHQLEQSVAKKTEKVVELKRNAVTTKIEYVYQDRIVKEREQAKVIFKEVPKYVTVKDDASCAIPDGFVGLWNAANRGEIPKPATEADGTTGDASGPVAEAKN